FASLTEEDGKIGFKPVRREALYTEDGMSLFPIPEVVTQPCLQVPVRRDSVAVEQLQLTRRVTTCTCHPAAFRLHPKPVEVLADPALHLPVQALCVACVTPLEALAQQQVVKAVAMV